MEAAVSEQIDPEEDLVKGLNELKVADKTIRMGSQEFQKALLECDLSRESSGDEEQFRRRSHTIDSSYIKQRHHSVSFASNLVSTTPEKHKSHEEIHPRSILRHHGTPDLYEEEDNRPMRRNTLDNTYKVNKKFYTRPEKQCGSDEKLHKNHAKDNSKNHAIHEKDPYSSCGKSYHPNHFHSPQSGSPTSPRRAHGHKMPQRRISEDRSGSSQTKMKLSQGQGVRV